MPVGLEVYDAQGRTLISVNSSVLRITQTVDYAGYLKMRQNNPPSPARQIFLASAFVDLDARNDDFLSGSEDEIFNQWYKYADVILVGEFNARNQ